MQYDPRTEGHTHRNTYYNTDLLYGPFLQASTDYRGNILFKGNFKLEHGVPLHQTNLKDSMQSSLFSSPLEIPQFL